MVKLTITTVKMTNKNITVIKGIFEHEKHQSYTSKTHKNFYLADNTGMQSATIMVTARVDYRGSYLIVIKKAFENDDIIGGK